MPTIHREDGFRFVIYFGDHHPPHVHVWKAGVSARVLIGDVLRAPAIYDVGTMPAAMARRAERIVQGRQQYFLAAWRRLHGS